MILINNEKKLIEQTNKDDTNIDYNQLALRQDPDLFLIMLHNSLKYSKIIHKVMIYINNLFKKSMQCFHSNIKTYVTFN